MAISNLTINLKIKKKWCFYPRLFVTFMKYYFVSDKRGLIDKLVDDCMKVEVV